MDLTLNTECQTLKSRKVASFATSIEENSNVCNWHLWSIRLYLATGRIKYIGTELTLNQLIKKNLTEHLIWNNWFNRQKSGRCILNKDRLRNYSDNLYEYLS